MINSKLDFLVDICDIEMGGVVTLIKVKNKNTGHEFVECIKKVDYFNDLLTYTKITNIEGGASLFEDKYIKFDKLMRAKDIYIDVIKVDSKYDNYIETHYIKVQ